MILCDTGVLLCLVDRSQPKHEICRQAVVRLQQPLITTWACLTETMYLALKRGGWTMQKQVAQYFLDDLLTIYEIPHNDYGRLFGLMEQYRDRPMDLADATLVLTAENIQENEILTLDSDFLFYRIGDRESFNIIQL
jgi:predicted nucleic acid-binding protein